MHDPTSRHLSSVWIQKLHTEKRLQVDKRHINAYSCFGRLLLHFYAGVQDDDRHVLDEAIEIVLDYFVEVQCRLQYPNLVTAATVAESVRTVKSIRTSGFGVIHGVPSAASELTDVIARLKEKYAEEAIRAVWKKGVKDAKARDTSENDVDSDSERKTNQ